jgi:hypothetical protein
MLKSPPLREDRTRGKAIIRMTRKEVKRLIVIHLDLGWLGKIAFDL